MSWTCEECGGTNPDSAFKCEGCGKSLRRNVHLCGPLKTLSFHAQSDIGRTVYSRLVGDESRYADRTQYQLAFLEDSGDWTLTPKPRTAQAVLVNGAACAENVPVVLRTGDVIELGSRKSDAKVAAITVQIDD